MITLELHKKHIKFAYSWNGLPCQGKYF